MNGLSSVYYGCSNEVWLCFGLGMVLTCIIVVGI